MNAAVEIVKYLLKSFVLLRDIFGYMLPGTIFAALIFFDQSWKFLNSNPPWLLILAALTACYMAGNALYALGIGVSNSLFTAYVKSAKLFGRNVARPRHDNDNTTLYCPAWWEIGSEAGSGTAPPHRMRHDEMYVELDATSSALTPKDRKPAERRLNERKWYMQGLLYPSLYPDIFVEPQRHEDVQIMRVGLSMGMILAGILHAGLAVLGRETDMPDVLGIWTACSATGVYFLLNSRYGKAGDEYLKKLYRGAIDASALRLEIETMRMRGGPHTPAG
ncbi:MAG: hypothetical protein ACREHE_11070 [Rhizomicrobium sp.]